MTFIAKAQRRKVSIENLSSSIMCIELRGIKMHCGNFSLKGVLKTTDREKIFGQSWSCTADGYGRSRHYRFGVRQR